jgi:peptidoglycan/LPS O-acetylase OafA/YrhL
MASRARVVVRVGVVTLGIAGAVVTFVSLWVPYTYWWSWATDIPGWEVMPGAKVAAIKSARIDDSFNDPAWSPIVLGVRNVDDAGRYDPPGFPLRWWEGGPTPMGAVTLVTAVAAMSAAITAAAAGSRHSRRQPTPTRWTEPATHARQTINAPGVPQSTTMIEMRAQPGRPTHNTRRGGPSRIY